MDKRGIGLFVLLTLGAGWLIEGVLFFPDLLTLRHLGAPGSLVLLVLLYLPWIAAWLVSRKAPPAPTPAEPPKPMTWPVFLVAALFAPVLFVVVYTVTAFTGIVAPDWAMGTLVNALKPTMEQLGQSLEGTTAALPTTILVLGMLLTYVLGATVYTLVALGGEKGWRSFLLPRLLPLGRVPAYVIVGLLWGLLFLPIIIDWYADFGSEGRRFAEARSFILRFLVMSVFLSIILGEIWRRRRSAGVTAVVLGGFLGQMQGGGISMWSYLFPQVAEPWTGSFGVVSLIIWGLAALTAILLPGRWGEGAVASGPVAAPPPVRSRNHAPPEPVRQILPAAAPLARPAKPAPMVASVPEQAPVYPPQKTKPAKTPAKTAPAQAKSEKPAPKQVPKKKAQPHKKGQAKKKKR